MDNTGRFHPAVTEQFWHGRPGRKDRQRSVFRSVWPGGIHISYLLFLAVSFVISNNRNPKAYRKMAGFLLLFLSACALMQLLTDGYFDGTSIMDYYKNSSAYQTGGGILGGLLCNIFGKPSASLEHM